MPPRSTARPSQSDFPVSSRTYSPVGQNGRYRFVLLENAALPDAFIKYSQAPKQTAALAPDVIAEKRDAWIQAWTDIVMK